MNRELVRWVRIAFAVILIFVASATVITTASAANWTQNAHDQQNTGHAPDTLAPTGNPTVDWTFDVSIDHTNGGIKDGGNGSIWRSSPVVYNGTVYFGDTGHGISPSYVYAVDKATGSLEWRAGRGGDFRSAPSVHNGKVYIGNEDGKLFVLDAGDGTEEFRIDLDDNTAASAVNSPTVADGTVYFGSHKSQVYAYDATSGVIEWTEDLPNSNAQVRDAPAYEDGDLYVTETGLSGLHIVKYDGGTGQELWNETVFDTGTAQSNLEKPVLAHGNVYVTGQDKLYAYDQDTGAEVWNFTDNDGHASSPAVAGCSVYYVSYGSGDLYSVDAGTGEENWVTKLSETATRAPSVANGTSTSVTTAVSYTV